ncbi:B3/B4 domain-containing protein [Corynebacterium striatum]|uniref:B3/B4 domain-containing protein n=1 Tax=Corynebacterium striatum TaxID=43770 RepID=UPI001A20C135|nr:hypothetical protein [Corynebacterium striatum]
MSNNTSNKIRSTGELIEFLADASISPEVAALHPDYRALLIAVDGITPAPSDAHSEQLLRNAEEVARTRLGKCAVTDFPHIAAWREAYQGFGAKPSRTRNSAEALMRRAEKGLPRINRLTDIYNSLSVTYEIPFGGEDLNAYVSAPQLVRATGAENFATMDKGEPVTEHPEPGEVVWRDANGVTCRRWNWRQCTRTALHDDTTAALFILDALEPVDDVELRAVGENLIDELREYSSELVVAMRILRAEDDD